MIHANFPINGTSEKNDHHGLPRSFLGSSDQTVNISRLYKYEHDAFHQVAGHLPPDGFLRTVTLSSIGWKNPSGLSIEEDFYRELLSQLTPLTWESMYQRAAINHFLRQDEPDRYGMAALHMHQLLQSEMRVVRQIIQSLLVGSLEQTQPLQKTIRYLDFFRRDNPVSAMYAFLTEISEDGDKKWAKPLNPSVYSKLCSVTKNPLLVYRRRSTYSHLLKLMEGHLQRLVVVSREWTPHLREVEDNLSLRTRENIYAILTSSR